MDHQHPYGFPTVFGRNLLPEMVNFVRPPFVVATMEDLWEPMRHLFEGADCQPLFVRSMEVSELDKTVAGLEEAQAVVGLGGGQALDTAKYIAWKRDLPLFQVPTALSTNAAYGQRSGVRDQGMVYYRGWAVPEAVYIDYDILQAAPRQLNLSGICDVLCFHTGVLDWRYAAKQGKCEDKWPFDEELAEQSMKRVNNLMNSLLEIKQMTTAGIRALADGLMWGTSYHSSGWCPRHIEGIDHFVFYALEALTGVKFLHGQPVCLGIVVGSMLHNSRADEMLAAIVGTGFDIRPEAMGITWEQTETALLGLRDFVHEKKLWHSIAHDVQIDKEFVGELRTRIEQAYRMHEVQ